VKALSRTAGLLFVLLGFTAWAEESPASAASHHWDWSQKPNAPAAEDCKQHSVQESAQFYQKLLPPRGFYQIFAIPEPADAKDEGMRPYSFVVFRVRDGRNNQQKNPVLEQIVGPVRGKEEMTLLFSMFRRYASSPPIGYYCWQNDCRGKYSPAGDADPLGDRNAYRGQGRSSPAPRDRDPYPPEMPDHTGITVSVGYVVTRVPKGSYVLRRNAERGIGGSGLEAGTGGSGCNFVARGKTVLTGEVIENLRATASRTGHALDAVPDVPNAPKSYPPEYR